MMPQSYLTHVCLNAHFRLPWLIFIVIQHWDYFTSCIYTKQEYARDYTDFCWYLRGNVFTYKAIYCYFKGMAREQMEILKERRDMRVLSESLPYLSGLRTIKLSFARAKEDRLLWFSQRLFIDNGKSYSVHIEAVLHGMAAAKNKELAIESVEVDGMHSHPTIEHGGFTKESLASVKSFKAIDSPGLLSLLSTVPLPYLERLEVADCWLVRSKLINFLEAQNWIIEYVEFQKTHLSYEKIGHDSRTSNYVKIFLEIVSEAGCTGKIEKLVIIRTA